MRGGTLDSGAFMSTSLGLSCPHLWALRSTSLDLSEDTAPFDSGDRQRFTAPAADASGARKPVPRQHMPQNHYLSGSAGHSWVDAAVCNLA